MSGNSTIGSPEAHSTRLEVDYPFRSNFPHSLSKLFCLTLVARRLKQFKKEQIYISKIAKVNFKPSQGGKRGRSEELEQSLTPSQTRPSSRIRVSDRPLSPSVTELIIGFESDPTLPNSGMSQRSSQRLTDRRGQDPNPYNLGPSLSTKHLTGDSEIIPLPVLSAISSIGEQLLNSTVITTLAGTPGIPVSGDMDASVMDTGDTEDGDTVAIPLVVVDPGVGQSSEAGAQSVPPVSEPLSRIQPGHPFAGAGTQNVSPPPPAATSAVTSAGTPTQLTATGDTPSPSTSSPSVSGVTSSSTASSLHQTPSTPAPVTSGSQMVSFGPLIQGRTPVPADSYWMLTTLKIISSLFVGENPGEIKFILFPLGRYTNSFETNSYKSLSISVGNTLSVAPPSNWANVSTVFSYLVSILRKYVASDPERKLMMEHSEKPPTLFKHFGEQLARHGALTYNHDSWVNFGYFFHRETIEVILKCTSDMHTAMSRQLSGQTVLEGRGREFVIAVEELDRLNHNFLNTGPGIKAHEDAINKYLTTCSQYRDSLERIFNWKTDPSAAMIASCHSLFGVECFNVNSLDDLKLGLVRARTVHLILNTAALPEERAIWEPILTASHVLQHSQQLLDGIYEAATNHSRSVTGTIDSSPSQFPPLNASQTSTASVVSPPVSMTPPGSLGPQGQYNGDAYAVHVQSGGPGQPPAVHAQGGVSGQIPSVPLPPAISHPGDPQQIIQDQQNQEYAMLLYLMQKNGIRNVVIPPPPGYHVSGPPVPDHAGGPHHVQSHAQDQVHQGAPPGPPPPGFTAPSGQSGDNSVISGNMGSRWARERENIVNVEDEPSQGPFCDDAERKYLMKLIMSFRGSWRFPSSKPDISAQPESDASDNLAEIFVLIDDLKSLQSQVQDFDKGHPRHQLIISLSSGNPNVCPSVQDASLFLRECKVFLNKCKNRYESHINLIREQAKQEQTSLIKSMAPKPLPILKFDSQIVPWIIEVFTIFKINATYRGSATQLAKTLMDSIEMTSLRASLESVKNDPNEILRTINREKFIDGFASKNYFSWTLINRFPTILTVPANGRKAYMKRQIDNFRVVYSNLAKIRRLGDISIEFLKVFADAYLFDSSELGEWRMSISYYSSCSTQLLRDSALHNLRRNAPISQSDPDTQLSLSVTGANVTSFSPENYLNNSALDVSPLELQAQPIPVSGSRLWSDLGVSSVPVTALEYARILLAFCEMVMHRIKIIENGAESVVVPGGLKPAAGPNKSKSYSNTLMHPHVTEAGGGDNQAAAPVVAEDASSDMGQGYGDPNQAIVQSSYLNKSVLNPELQNTPLPFPTPSPAVLKKYKSVPCVINGCKGSHPNGTVFFCKLFMALILAAKLDLVKKHRLCKSCLRQHANGSKCDSNITCIFCKHLGREHTHNAAICQYSRFRFPCIDLATVGSNQNPAIAEPMCDQDFIWSYSCPSQSEVIPDPGEPQSAPADTAGIDQIFNNLPLNYFGKTKELLSELASKIRLRRAEEKSDKSKRPTNHIPVESVADGTSLLPLLQHQAVAEQGGAEGGAGLDLADLAKLEIPDYLQVNEMLSLYNFILSSLPLRCDEPVVSDKKEILFKRNGCYLNFLGKIESDKDHAISEFSVDQFEFIVARPSNRFGELYHNICKIQNFIHSNLRGCLLQFGIISFILYLENEQINRLNKLPDVHIFCNKESGMCTVSIYCLFDTGCSGLSLSGSVIDALDPLKIRQVNFEVQTANGSYPLRDHEFNLSIQSKNGMTTPIVVQRLKGDLNVTKLTPKQAAILNCDFGEFKGENSFFNKFCGQRKAYALIGQSHPAFRTTEIFDPRFIGFENHQIMNPRLRCYLASDLFHETCLFGGELGLDWSNQGPHHFIILPSDAINRQTMKLRSHRILSEEWLQDRDKVDHKFTAQLNQSARLEINEPVNSQGSRLPAPDVETLRFIEMSPDTALRELFRYFENTNCVNAHSSGGSFVSRAECNALADFIMAESAALTPFIFCKHHDKISKHCASSCDACKVLNSNSDCIRDYSLYKRIWNNLSLEPVTGRPGYFYPLQRMQFIDDTHFIGRLAASNFEAALASSQRLVKRAIKLDCLPVLDKQMTDRLTRDELELLTLNELRDIIDEKIPSQFVLNNYVVSPEKSTRTRLVMNSGLPILGTPRSLATSNRAPRTEALQDIWSVCVRKRMATVCLASDIKRAYLNIKYTREDSFLFITVWFHNPQSNGTERAYCARFKCLQFGAGAASVILSIVLDKFVANNVPSPEAKTSTEDDKYVDNVFSLYSDYGTAARVLSEIMTESDRCGLEMDKVFVPHCLFESDNEDVQEFIKKHNIPKLDSTVGFGYTWDLSNDTWSPYLKVTCYDKIRGDPTGPDISLTDFSTITFTRALVCKLVPSYYDCLNCMMGPLIGSAKILLSRTCKICPLDDQNSDISNYDNNLSNILRKFFTETKRFTTEYVPLQRTCVPLGHKIVAFITSHDGSVEAVSCCVHVLTEHTVTKVRQCMILSAKQTVSAATPFVNECKSYVLGALHLHAVVRAVRRFLDRDNPPEIIFVGDNQPSSHLFASQDPTQMIARSTKFSVIRVCYELQSLLPTVHIKQCYLNGIYLAADLNSKLTMKPLEASNDSLWRHGPGFYLDLEILTTFTFFHYHDGVFTYHRLPVFENTQTLTFLELIEKYRAGRMTRDLPMSFCRGGLLSDLNVRPSSKNHIGPSRATPADHDPTSCVLCPGDPSESHSPNLSGELPVSVRALAASVLNYDDSQFELDTIFPQSSYLDPDFDPKAACQYFGDPMWSLILTLENNEPETQDDALVRSTECSEQYLYYTSACSSLALPSLPQTETNQKRYKMSPAQREHYCKGRVNDNFLTRVGDPIAFIESQSFLFSNTLFNEILSKREDFIKIVNICRNVIKFILLTRKVKIDKKFNFNQYCSLVCWRSLVISDQSLNPPASARGVVKSHNNIKFVTLRAEQRCIPIVSKTSPLLVKFISQLHKSPTGLSRFPAIHNYNKTVLALIFRSHVSLYCDNLDGLTAKVAKDCFNCRRTKLEARQVPLGPRHFLISPKTRINSVISLDPCYSLCIRAFKNSRKSLQTLPILAICCEYSGIFSLVPIGGLTCDDLALGIKTFEAAHNACVRVIISDAGNALNAALLESKGTWSVKNHLPSAQHKNVVEHKIGLSKRIFRSLFRHYRSENRTITTLDFFQLSYLCHAISLSVNVIPYNKGSIFSPAYLKHNAGLIEAFEADVTPETFPGSDPLSKLRKHLVVIKQIRNEVLASMALRSGHSYNLRSGSDKTVHEGDLCLYTPTSVKRGLLAKVLRPNPRGSTSVYVQLVRGKEYVELRYLFVIVAANSPGAQTFNSDYIPPELERSMTKKPTTGNI